VSTLHPAEPSAEQLARFTRELKDFVAEQQDGIYLRALREAPLAHSLRAGELDMRWGKATVVADDPDKLVSDRSATRYHLSSALQPLFADIQRELLIFSPYFVPGREGTAFLVDLANRGVRVSILTNSLASTDVAVVHAGYAKYRKQLLRAGIELFEMKPNHDADGHKDKDQRMITGSSRASLHAKSFVLDRDTVFIGSLNLDPRSFVENSEIGVLLEDPATAAELSDWFDHNVPLQAYRLVLETAPDGRETIRWIDDQGENATVFDRDPESSWVQRLLVGLASLLPIESQL
jgi:putative cardiolipin synthase